MKFTNYLLISKKDSKKKKKKKCLNMLKIKYYNFSFEWMDFMNKMITKCNKTSICMLCEICQKFIILILHIISDFMWI